jgi:hypothetical protein
LAHDAAAPGGYTSLVRPSRSALSLEEPNDLFARHLEPTLEGRHDRL